MNEAIRTYINSQFTTLPRTAEVERARQELLQMSEDKYAELIAAGVSANEATGRVITEFGNLDELADDLGIRAAFDGAAESSVPVVGRDEAEGALRGNRTASFMIAGGVIVILLALASIATFFAPSQTSPWAAVILFPAVAIAVGLFIMSNVVNRPASRIANDEVRLSRALSDEYGERYEREAWRFALGLIAGITLLLLSLVATVVVQALFDGPNHGGGVFLTTVGLGVGVLVVTGMRRGILGYLASSADVPDPEDELEERSATRIGLIAPIYWPLVVLIYLAWSFIGDAWDRSWLVWPLAGVLFAVVVGVIYAAANWRGVEEK